MNKYDVDKILVDNDIHYPEESKDERSVRRRCREKKAVFCLTPKQKSR